MHRIFSSLLKACNYRWRWKTNKIWRLSVESTNVMNCVRLCVWSTSTRTAINNPFREFQYTSWIKRCIKARYKKYQVCKILVFRIWLLPWVHAVCFNSMSHKIRRRNSISSGQNRRLPSERRSDKWMSLQFTGSWIISSKFWLLRSWRTCCFETRSDFGSEVEA